MATSLFAHLAMRFGSHPENLATEALGFILQESLVARTAVSDMLRTLGSTISGDVLYSTQSTGEDDARPDLVARDSSGAEPILVEVKFWAGLTANQPVAYLDRLRPGGSLVVVAPAMRLPILWGELRHRCSSKAREFAEQSPNATGDRVARVDEKLIVLVSWRRLLAAIRIAVEGAGERSVAQDVAQLDGLCERMDVDAFLPVSREELSNGIFRRVTEFGRIVNDATSALVEKGIASTKGARSAGANGYYGRYFFLRNVGVFLICDIRKWMKYAATPLWLSVYGTKWRESDPEAAHRALGGLGATQAGKVFKAGDGFPTVALFVAPGAERDVVLARVVQEVEEIGEIIAPLGVGTATAPPAGEAGA